MKRFLLCLLVLAMLMGMAGCAAENNTVETTTETTTEPEVSEETVPETTEIIYEEPLYLKVSAINLSLVGDSEDIYLGLLPIEVVTFESDDESIVTFENGVVTATGVGTTTIRASYRDQVVEVTAGCLAETQGELLKLDDEIKRAPRRMPPEVDLKEPTTILDNATIVGDSISYFLFQHESKHDYMGNVQFLVRGGVSLRGFANRYCWMPYKGRELDLEKAFAEAGVQKAYIMLGQNDVGSTGEPMIWDNWTILLERILEANPGIEIYFQSSIPRRATENKENGINIRIHEYNKTLKQFAADNGQKFIDVEYYVLDHMDKMALCYSQGDYHMHEKGCLNWMKILRFYTQYELDGGILE